MARVSVESVIIEYAIVEQIIVLLFGVMPLALVMRFHEGHILVGVIVVIRPLVLVQDRDQSSILLHRVGLLPYIFEQDFLLLVLGVGIENLRRNGFLARRIYNILDVILALKDVSHRELLLALRPQVDIR